ncbi:MAG TPA: pyridoxamine 5'-phosphate oxidase [Hellea balneolensis]|uniref:Pyridoxamine 5'-phosphate oxidase n=1 Tax=Hellea balneolensis TaxID=287478 RepID=A0A7C5LTK1_9PROT|nr:pyridoxamine 5'-phosphate oxidase [Hellea balneolensis]
MTSPFHKGELTIQEHVGETELAARNGRLIKDKIPSGAASFLHRQRYCALGWKDKNDDIWAGLLSGEPGFAHMSETGRGLNISIDDQSGAWASNPSTTDIGMGSDLGILFMEYETRRRLRINGNVDFQDVCGMSIAVAEAYPNCAKYIQKREYREPVSQEEFTPVCKVGRNMTDEIIHWVSTADTVFVASALEDGPADVSHRGGHPGFVIFEDGVLHFPDYAGNSMFGTLGNFLLNPKAGLVFVDYHHSRQLQISGDVNLHLDGDRQDARTGGTGRWWTFTPRTWIISPLNHASRWQLVETSPFNH